jgi:hypothetical protein
VPNVLSVTAEDMLGNAKWRTLAWRKGTKGPLKARFAAVRVRVADGGAPLADEPDLFAGHMLHALVADPLRRPSLAAAAAIRPRRRSQ